MKNKQTKKGYAYGSMVRKPMYGGGMAMSPNPMMDRRDKMGMTSYSPSGMMYGGKMKKMAKGGELKKVPADNPGMSKLPKKVRNRMGYMAYGGTTMMKKK
jgi:hypothetical protein